jgi:hypothetical protein
VNILELVTHLPLPLLILVTICIFLWGVLFLLLLTFFPGLTERLARLIDAVRHSDYANSNTSSRRIRQHLRQRK